MYLGECSLIRLRAFIDGYSFMAHESEIELHDKPDFGGFHDWVAAKFEWRESTAGWCNIILEECGRDDRRAMENFFELIDEYQRTAEDENCCLSPEQP
jgi:hypothetical protein